MYEIDVNNQLGEYLLDDKRKISKVHLNSVCKIGQGEEACRYIALSQIGYVCMKKSPARATIDMWSRTDKFSAKEDNCEGLGEGY